MTAHTSFASAPAAASAGQPSAGISSSTRHFHAFTRLPRLFFITIGVTPFHPINGPSERSRSRTLRESAQLAWFAVSFTNCALCVLGEIIYLLRTFTRSDFVETTSLVLCIGFILLAFVKIGTILWQRRQLNVLMAALHDMCPRTATTQRLYQADEYVAHAQRLQRVYAWIQMAMIWLFNFYPLTTTVMGWAQDGDWQMDFPYVIWYPFNPYGRGWFEVNYVSQIWAAYFSACGILATDLLLCGVIVQLCMHYDRLRDRLRDYLPGGAEGRVRFRRAEDVARRDYAELCDFVRVHDAIMGLGARLDDIFGVCVLFNVVSSIVILCVLGFLVVTAGVSVALIKYVLTLVTCTGQIFMVCLLGEKCVDASMGIATGAWEGKWYRGDDKFRRGVLMIITRGSRPQCLTAYKFSVASMAMFSGVMSRAWQFFAVLRSAFEQ